jgi:signal transduction histidine kinase
VRRWSLRGWLLFVSTLFAVLVVGGVALTTFVIVTDGMQTVAYETTVRASQGITAAIREAVAAAQAEIGSASAGDQSDRMLRQRLSLRLGDFASAMGASSTYIALYEGQDPLWYSVPDALHPSLAPARERAVSTGAQTRSIIARKGLAPGLFGSAHLSRMVAHVPLELPGLRDVVIDVTYAPFAEERAIDEIRLPMTVLAVSAMIVMIFLMQTSMTWVLSLVDDLRRAADSIDAGRLDERLPEVGDNEIGELARSLNRLIERLRRRSEAQGRFVADASHELATPVAGIRGYTSILRAWGADDAKVRDEAIDAIDRESRRMARLTNELLSLLHADQGLRLSAERFDLNSVVRERLAATANRVIERGIEFVGPEDESLTVVGDRGRVEDVLSILLENAAKYTPDGGRVEVRTSRRREQVTISVTDTGKGIAEEDLARLFDRFFRSEQARADGEVGFGLGLAIAKSILDNMNATIDVTSTVGVGTTFTIMMPRGRL